MVLGMAMASTANFRSGIVDLAEFLTGLGIGGMLAATNATVAEFANTRRRRTLCISLMAIGYPIGATAGGAITAGPPRQ